MLSFNERKVAVAENKVIECKKKAKKQKSKKEKNKKKENIFIK